MPRYNFLKNTFAFGEVSPRAEGRTDLEIYKSGCRKLENMFVKPVGGAYRRHGSRFLTALDAKAQHLLSFRDYAIIFIEDSTQLYYSGGFGSPTAITNFGTANADYVNPWDIQYVETSDSLWLVSGEKKPQRVQSTFGFGPDSLSPQDYEVITGYTYNPNAWATIAWSDKNLIANRTMALSASNPGNTGVTITGPSGFQFPVGAYYWLQVANKTTIIEITIGGTTTATGKIHYGPNTGAIAATADWYESAWNSKNGYPTAVTFFQDRLYMARGSTFWASRIGSHHAFSHLEPDGQVITDATGIKGTIKGSGPAGVQWMSGGKSLVIGTGANENIAQGQDESKTITQTNYKISTESSYGSNQLQARRIQNTLLFVGKDGLKVRELNFEFATDRYRAETLNALSEHIPNRKPEDPPLLTGANDGFRVWTYSEYPDQQLFLIQNGSSTIYALTRDTQSKVAAWSRSRIAGVDAVLSLCIPESSMFESTQYLHVLCVRGTTKTLERISLKDEYSVLDAADPLALPLPAWDYVDGFTNTFDLTPKTVWPGFDHLEGQTVQVWGDYVYVGEKVVTGGSITLDAPVESIAAGIKYKSVLQSVPPEIGSVLGSAAGNIARIDQVAIKFYKSGAAAIGRDADHLEVLDFGDGDFTGIKTVDFMGDYDQEATVWIETDATAPMEISWIAMRGNLNEV